MKANRCRWLICLLLGSLLNLTAWPVQARQAAASPGLPQLAAIPPYLPVRYVVQSGDTLTAVARHFGVQPDEIASPATMSPGEFLTPGQLLLLPPRATAIPAAPALLPDSEVVFGPAAADFDTAAYLKSTAGYLLSHQEYLRSPAWTPASQVLERVALENSINPRLLLALLEYECHCVLGQPDRPLVPGYLLGVMDFLRNGLYGQLGWAANQLSIGYYGWRSGALTEFRLADGTLFRPHPAANAGTVALQYYFAQRDFLLLSQSITDSEKQAVRRQLATQPFTQALDPQKGFPALYQRMFGDAWERAQRFGPIFPPELKQPGLILPFEPGRVWAYTSGPHKAWETEGALAALDFAPASMETGCIPSDAWVVAAADGLVVRSEFGSVIEDLDPSGLPGPAGSLADGLEQTGWAILYMHIRSDGRVPKGARLHQGDLIGHPSCEGGPATGTHTHIARKYNGEWVAADGPLPFVLSGWTVHAGLIPFQGTMTKDGQTVIAHPYGSFETRISRPAQPDWWLYYEDTHP